MTVAQASDYLEFIYRAHRKALDRLTLIFTDAFYRRGQFTAEQTAEMEDLRERLRGLDIQVHLANEQLRVAQLQERETIAAAWSAKQAERSARRAELETRRQAREAKAKAKAAQIPEPVSSKVVPPLRVWVRSAKPSTDSLERPELPVPITPLRAGGEVHYFPDEIERRARAMEYWTPWGKRRTRSSRRYEGYHR